MADNGKQDAIRAYVARKFWWCYITPPPMRPAKRPKDSATHAPQHGAHALDIGHRHNDVARAIMNYDNTSYRKAKT
jgi:hypothetical protein